MGTLATAEKNRILNAFIGSASYSNASVWVKLHTGAPGTDGTAAAAGDTRRQQSLFTNAAANGTAANTSLIEWTNVSNTETLSYVSLWTASTGGSFVGSDDLSSTAPVTAGDTFRIPVGQLTLTIGD